MKRFHVHVGVTDIDKSVAFYSSLFGAEPAVLKAFLTDGESTTYGGSPDLNQLASANAASSACCAPQLAPTKTSCC